MTLKEITQHAIEQEKLQDDNPRATCIFVLQGKWTKNGVRRLVPLQGSPLGKCVGEVDTGRIAVMFFCRDIIEWAATACAILLQERKARRRNGRPPGQCRDCRQAPLPGKSRCERHMETHRQRSNRAYRRKCGLE